MPGRVITASTPMLVPPTALALRASRKIPGAAPRQLQSVRVRAARLRPFAMQEELRESSDDRACSLQGGTSCAQPFCRPVLPDRP